MSKNDKITPQFLAEKTWDLYQTFGVPIEVSEDILESHGLKLDSNLLNNLITEHQKLSQTTSAGQFKSGLDQDSLKTRKLHTSTHILHSVLRKIFGEEVKQKGSAITNEKARFDFTLANSLSPEEINTIQQQVQAVIDRNLEMERLEMKQEEAKQLGAIGLFGEKYGDIVSIYTLKDGQGTVYSREFCGGPHIQNSNEIGKFVILKQKSIGQGLKRLEFTVED
jgi:alanyl-tRNA synthetase